MILVFTWPSAKVGHAPVGFPEDGDIRVSAVSLRIHPTPEMSQQPTEIPQQSSEISPHPDNPGQCLPSIPARGTPSLEHMAVDPPTGTVTPRNPAEAQIEVRKYLEAVVPVRKKYWLIKYIPLAIGWYFICATYGTNVVVPSSDGVGCWVWSVRAVQLNKISQVAILGTVTKFDQLDTQSQLSVTWRVVGCGEYELRAAQSRDAVVNRAVDVYLDKWVKSAVLLPRGYSATGYECITPSLFV